MNKIIFALRFKSILPAVYFLCFLTPSVIASEKDNNVPFSKPSLRGNGMEFTENKGQVIDMKNNLRPDVLFVGDGGGGKVYLKKGAVSYVYSNIGQINREIDEQVEKRAKAGRMNEINQKRIKDSLLLQALLKVHRVDIDFVGGNVNAKTINEDRLEGQLNFYYPHCKEGITKVHAYNKVTYEDMYPGIDVVYYGGKEKGLEYDIVVKPNADPKQIRLKYSGASNMVLKDNSLTITTSLGLLGEYMPKVYQVINNKEIIVESKYVLKKMENAECRMQNEKKSNTDKQKLRTNNNQLSTNNYEVTFELSGYNTNYPLIIDPWVTYYGGSGFEFIGSITTDASNNVIFSGTTTSPDFPVSPGAYQAVLNSFNGNGDLFLVKLTSNCTRVFATYFGGKDPQGFVSAAGVAADAAGNIFFTGSTSQTDFPILDPAGGAYFQNTLSPGGGLFGSKTADAFISKFDPAGALLWSTYYGGTDNDNGMDVSIDKANNVILSGSTLSTNLPVQSAYQPTNEGLAFSSDAFIVKFNNAGIRSWATYLGGENSETLTGVATDNSNNVFITGYTSSTQFPVTPGAYQSRFKNSTGFFTQDIFLSKLDPLGALSWSTYYGGSDFDEGYGIATDGTDNVIITGGTSSIDFPVSATAYQTSLNQTFGFGTDAILAKFDNNGNWLWATYYGGTNFEEPSGVATDNSNNIIISGDTYSIDVPVTSCAYQTAFKGSEDQYIATFDANGSILCSGYLGVGDPTSPNNETFAQGGSIAVGGNNAYLVAYTDCNYPVTSNAFQVLCGGGFGDAAVAQLCIQSCGTNSSSINPLAGNSILCVGDSVDFNTNNVSCGASTYQWYFPGGTPATSNLQNPKNIVYNAPGNYDVKLVVSSSCGTDSTTKVNYIKVYSPTTIITTDTAICIYNSTPINVTTVSGVNGTYYTWSPSYGLNTTTGSSLVANPTTTILYYVKGVCGEKDSVLVTIWPLPTISLIPSPSICVGGPTNLTVLGTNYYSWSPSSYLNATTGAMVTTNSTAIITYTVKGTDNNGCISVPKTVIIYPLPQVSFISDITTGCQPLFVLFTNQTQTVSPPTTCFWNFGDGGTSNIASPPTYEYFNAGIYTVTLTVTDNKGCVNTLVQPNMITVYPVPTANFTYAPQPITIINADIRYTDQSAANSSTFSTTITNWDWTFGDIDNGTSIQQNPKYTYNDTGTFVTQLIVTDGHGCQDTITHLIKIDPDYVFYIPNSFTPNGDNKNDVFIPHTLVIMPSEYEFVIFDRWGNIVFETNNYKQGWDGTVRSTKSPAQTDVYEYLIKLKDYEGKEHQFMGHLTLFR